MKLLIDENGSTVRTEDGTPVGNVAFNCLRQAMEITLVPGVRLIGQGQMRFSVPVPFVGYEGMAVCQPIPAQEAANRSGIPVATSEALYFPDPKPAEEPKPKTWRELPAML
jgi:hypothetical protein